MWEIAGFPLKCPHFASKMCILELYIACTRSHTQARAYTHLFPLEYSAPVYSLSVLSQWGSTGIKDNPQTLLSYFSTSVWPGCKQAPLSQRAAGICYHLFTWLGRLFKTMEWVKSHFLLLFTRRSWFVRTQVERPSIFLARMIDSWTPADLIWYRQLKKKKRSAQKYKSVTQLWLY